MYVPTLVKTEPGAGGRASITMALPDSGNLLAHAAIDARFHKQLGIPIEDMKITVRAANKLALGDTRSVERNIPKIPLCGPDVHRKTTSGQESLVQIEPRCPVQLQNRTYTTTSEIRRKREEDKLQRTGWHQDTFAIPRCFEQDTTKNSRQPRVPSVAEKRTTPAMPWG